jgi:hypothetical protein
MKNHQKCVDKSLMYYVLQSKECTIALWRWAYVFLCTRDFIFLSIECFQIVSMFSQSPCHEITCLM